MPKKVSFSFKSTKNKSSKFYRKLSKMQFERISIKSSSKGKLLFFWFQLKKRGKFGMKQKNFQECVRDLGLFLENKKVLEQKLSHFLVSFWAA